MKAKIVIGVLVAVGALWLVATSIMPKVAVAPGPQSAAAASGSIDFVPQTLHCGDKWVEGDVKNSTNRTAHLVQLTILLDDASGNQVGHLYESTYHLGPGQTWHFISSVDEQDYARCRAYLNASF